MGINLEPYNYWILYGALVLLLICLIIAGVKALKLLKAVKTYQPVIDHMQTNTKLAQIKVEAMQEKKKEDAAKNKTLKLLIPILLAIKHTYDNDADLNGARGYAKAASQVVKKRTDERKLFAQFKKEFM